VWRGVVKLSFKRGVALSIKFLGMSSIFFLSFYFRWNIVSSALLNVAGVPTRKHS